MFSQCLPGLAVPGKAAPERDLAVPFHGDLIEAVQEVAIFGGTGGVTTAGTGAIQTGNNAIIRQ